MNLVEDSAMGFLKAKIYANETLLMKEFIKQDPQNTGSHFTIT